MLRLMKGVYLMNKIKLIGVIGACALFAGCGSKEIKLDPISNFSTGNKSPLEIFQKEFNGNKIIFIADNQRAMIKTEPVFEQSKFSEKSLNTAHRRAALDAFSLDIVESIFKSQSHDLVIHVGDLLNNSCLDEYKEVENTLNSNKKPWFVAPGNHDGYYMGISSPTAISKGAFSYYNGILDERAGWALVCNDAEKKRRLGTTGFSNIKNYEKYADTVVDKTRFNGLYLDSLGILDLKSHATKKSLGEDSVGSEYKGYSLYCLNFSENNLHKGYMSDICWTEYELGKTPGNHINDFTYMGDNAQYEQWEEKKPWLNFVVQKLEVKLDKKTIDIIIIDTSSYTNGVGIKDSGGFSLHTYGAADAAHLSVEQFSVLSSWLKSGRETYVIGHHPMGDFDKESLTRLHDLFKDEANKIVKYISGDTHDGYDVKFKFGDEIHNNKKHVLDEANLGSTIDAPIEYALLGEADDGVFLKRVSLTPLKETRIREKAGAVKFSGIVKIPKDYAYFDNKLWSGVCGFENGWIFLQSITPQDPFLGSTPSQHFEFSQMTEIPQADKWWGLHYVLNPFSIMDIRHKSLESYKINRLSQLISVYDQMFEYAGIEKTDKAKSLEKEYFVSLNNLKTNVFNAYSDDESQPFNWVLQKQNLLLNELEAHDMSSKKGRDFRVCSALYEAEREYRNGFMEN